MKFIYYKINGKEKTYTSFLKYIKILRKHKLNIIFFVFYDEFISKYYKSKSFYYNSESSILFVPEDQNELFLSIYNRNLPNFSIRFERTPLLINAQELNMMITRLRNVFIKNMQDLKQSFLNYINFKNKRIYVDSISIINKTKFFAKIQLNFKFATDNSIFNEIIVPNYINKV